MEEKNRYSIDEILSEVRSRSSAHAAKDISAKADLQAQEILEQLKAPASAKEDLDFDALLKSITARTASRSDRREKPMPPAPETDTFAKTAVFTPVTPVHTQEEIVLAPTADVHPQIVKKHKSIDEVVDELCPADAENKIDKALHNQKDEKASTRAHALTRTGVIRKANALIEPAAEQTAPAAAHTPVRMGNPLKVEKIVGEKEDIQTKAYHEYLRQREKKKQDTGIIKSIDIKVASHDLEQTKVMPQRKASTLEQKPPVKDNTTEIEKTLVGITQTRIITDIRHTGNIEGQTRLEGFFDDDEVEKISENDLEEQLELNRREKIDAFELEKAFKDKNRDAVETASLESIDNTYAPEKETPIINDVVDYNSKSDQRAVYLELEELLGRFKLRAVLNFGAFLAAVLLGICGSGLIADFGLSTGNEKIYIILNTAIMLFALLVNARAVFKGLKALLMLKPSGDSLGVFSAVICLAHCIICFMLGETGAGVSHIYVGAATFIFLLNSLGKRSMIRRIFKNFRFVIKSGEKYSSACITDPKEIHEFSKGTQTENPDLRYNAKTRFPTRFLANSYADDPTDTIARHTVYPVIGFACIIALVCYFISKDTVGACSALTACLLIGVPASALMAFHKTLENADNALLKERGTITGFAAANDAANTSAIILSSERLFPAGCCSLKGMKLFKKMQMDEAILYAASVLSESVHPFKSVFSESISEVKDRMPKCFDTAYESRLGLSGWIYDRKVLLGTKEMMGAHGIEIPAVAKPEDYVRNNQRVIFLAIDGTVYAMFVVEYFADPVIQYELQRLEASGIEIFIRTQDANIDEALVSEIFELELSGVKVLGMMASEMYEEKTSVSVYNEAKLLNRGDPITFMRSITACSILSGQFRLLKTLQYIAIILGCVIVAVLSVLGSIASIGPVHIAGYAAFWMIVTNIIPRVYKAVPKR